MADNVVLTSMTCKQYFSNILTGISCSWKQQLIDALCTAYSIPTDLTCEQVHNCETLTTLSDFTSVGGQVCITYTDEHGDPFTRCFALEDSSIVITADNGLSKNTPTNVELGNAVAGLAPLLHDTYIDPNGFFTLWENVVVIDDTGVVGIGNFSSFNSTRLDVVDNSIGGDSIVNISTTSTSATGSTQKGLNIALSGANISGNERTYGAYISNTHGGTSPANTGLYSEVTGSVVSRAIHGVNSGSGAGVLGSGPWGVYGLSSVTSALHGVANSTANGLYAESTDNTVGVLVRNAASTNTVERILQVGRLTQGVAANGIGASLDFAVETDATTLGFSNQLISKWINATDSARISEFSITGVNNANTNTLVTVNGTGFTEITTNSGGSGAALRANAQSGGIAITGRNGVTGVWGTGTGFGVEGGSGTGIGVLATNSGSSTTSFPMLRIQNSLNTPTINDLIWIDAQTRITGGTTVATAGTFGFKMLNVTSGSTASEFFVNLNSGGDVTTVEAFAFGTGGYMRIRTITATEASAITPAEGMMVFVNSTDATFTSIGLWDYENGAWHKL